MDRSEQLQNSNVSAGLSNDKVTEIMQENNVPASVVTGNMEQAAVQNVTKFNNTVAKQIPTTAETSEQGIDKDFDKDFAYYVDLEQTLQKESDMVGGAQKSALASKGIARDIAFNVGKENKQQKANKYLTKAKKAKGKDIAKFEKNMDRYLELEKEANEYGRRGGKRTQALSSGLASADEMLVSFATNALITTVTGGAGGALIAGDKAVKLGKALKKGSSLLGKIGQASVMYENAKNMTEGEIYYDLIEQGVDEETAQRESAQAAKRQGIIESADVLTGLGRVAPKSILGAAKNALAKNKLKNMTTKQLLLKTAKEIGLGAGEEAITEGMQEFAQELDTQATVMHAQGMNLEDAYEEIITTYIKDLESGELSEGSAKLHEASKAGALAGGFMGGGFGTMGGAYKVATQTNAKTTVAKQLKKSSEVIESKYKEMAEKKSHASAKAFIDKAGKNGEAPTTQVFTTQSVNEMVEAAGKDTTILDGVIATLGVTKEEFYSGRDLDIVYSNYLEAKEKFPNVVNQKVSDLTVVQSADMLTPNQTKLSEQYAEEFTVKRTKEAVNTHMFWEDKLKSSNLTTKQKQSISNRLTQIVMNLSRAEGASVQDILFNADSGVMVNIEKMFSDEQAGAIEDGKAKAGDRLVRDPYLNTKQKIGTAADIRGDFTIEGIANTINLFNDHNVATILHEVNHWYWKRITLAYREGNLSPEWTRHVENVYDWLGKKGSKKNTPLTNDDYEKIAYAMEEKLLTGKSFVSGSNEVVEELQGWFADIYGAAKSMKYKDKPLGTTNEVSTALDMMLFAKEQVISQEEFEAKGEVSAPEGYLHKNAIKKLERDLRSARASEEQGIVVNLKKAISKGNALTSKQVQQRASNDFLEANKDNKTYRARAYVKTFKVDRDTLLKSGVNPNDYVGFVSKEYIEDPVTMDDIKDIPMPEADSLDGFTPEAALDIEEFAQELSADGIKKANYVIEKINNGEYVGEDGIKALQETKEFLAEKEPKMPMNFIEFVAKNFKITPKAARSLDLHNNGYFEDSKGRINWRGVVSSKGGNEKNIVEAYRQFTGSEEGNTYETSLADEAGDYLQEALDHPLYGSETSTVVEIEALRAAKDEITYSTGLTLNNIGETITAARKLNKAPNNGDFELSRAYKGKDPNDVAVLFNYPDFKTMLDEISSVGTLSQDARSYGIAAKENIIEQTMKEDFSKMPFAQTLNKKRFKVAVETSLIWQYKDLSMLQNTMNEVYNIATAELNASKVNSSTKNIEALINKYQNSAKEYALEARELFRKKEYSEAAKIKQKEAIAISIGDSIIQRHKDTMSVMKKVNNIGEASADRKYNQKNLRVIATMANNLSVKKMAKGKIYNDPQQYNSAIDEIIEKTNSKGLQGTMLNMRENKTFLWTGKTAEELTWGDLDLFTKTAESILSYGRSEQTKKGLTMKAKREAVLNAMKEEIGDKDYKKRKSLKKTDRNAGKFSTYKNGFNKFIAECVSSVQFPAEKLGYTFVKEYLNPLTNAFIEKNNIKDGYSKKFGDFMDENNMDPKFKEQVTIKDKLVSKLELTNMVINYGRLQSHKHLEKTIKDMFGENSDMHEVMQLVLSNLSKAEKDYIDMYWETSEEVFEMREQGANELEDIVVEKTAKHKFEDADGRVFGGGYTPLMYADRTVENDFIIMNRGTGVYIGDNANKNVKLNNAEDLDLFANGLNPMLEDVLLYALVTPKAVEFDSFLEENKDYIEEKIGGYDYDIMKGYIRNIFYNAPKNPVFDRVVRHFNKAAKIAILGSKPIQVPVQALGAITAIPRLGAGRILSGYAKFAYNSPKEIANLVSGKNYRSDALKQRASTGGEFGIDTTSFVKNAHTRKDRAINLVNTINMGFLRVGDSMASQIVFDAAMGKAMEETDLTESEMIDYANREVSITQGDFSSFAREHSSLVSLFMPFASFFVAQRGQMRQFLDTKDTAKFISALFWITFMSPMVEAATRAAFDDDDDDLEGYAKKALKNVVSTNASFALPGIGGNIAGAATGEFWGTSYNLPVTFGATSGLQGLGALFDILGFDGEVNLMDDELYYTAVSRVGTAFGFPLALRKQLDKIIFDK